MPSTINTNIASLNATRMMARGQAELNQAMTRLSSGLRINSAKDDAAGWAIAQRMDAQARGMTMAARNANDGISLAQTAEGGLSKVGDALQRMRELALQSANATNNASDKASLDKEFGELRSEVSRLLGATSFNNKVLLGAGATAMSIQIGPSTDAHDYMTLDLQDLTQKPALLALTGSSPQTQAQANQAAKDAAVAALSSYPSEAAAMAANYQPASSAAGAAYEAFRAGMVNNHGAGAASWADGVASATSAAHAKQLVNDSLAANNGGAGSPFWGNLAEAVYNAYHGVSPSQGSATIGASADRTSIGQVIRDLDSAIDLVNDQRAGFGAKMSRFDSIIANLQQSAENQAAARSRIMDADFAAETARLSKAQILMQAGNAMLAQANQAPNSVLALLR